MLSVSFFFCNATPPTDIYTLSLHDALPIYLGRGGLSCNSESILLLCISAPFQLGLTWKWHLVPWLQHQDRKSTRLNSSHSQISYAVFCLKKKNIKQRRARM